MNGVRLTVDTDGGLLSNALMNGVRLTVDMFFLVIRLILTIEHCRTSSYMTHVLLSVVQFFKKISIMPDSAKFPNGS